MCVRYKSHTITIRNVLQMCVRYKSHTITIRNVLQMCVRYKSHTITIRNVLQMCVRYKSHTITIRNVLQMCVRYKSHTITIRNVLQMYVRYKSHTITIRNVLQMCVRYKLHTKTIKKWTCDPKIWRSILIKITTAIDTERSSGWLPWSSVEIWKASFNVPGGHQGSHPGNLSIFVAKIQTNLETIISSGLSLAPFAMSKRPETDTMPQGVIDWDRSYE